MGPSKTHRSGKYHANTRDTDALAPGGTVTWAEVAPIAADVPAGTDELKLPLVKAAQTSPGVAPVAKPNVALAPPRTGASVMSPFIGPPTPAGGCRPRERAVPVLAQEPRTPQLLLPEYTYAATSVRREQVPEVSSHSHDAHAATGAAAQAARHEEASLALSVEPTVPPW